MTFALIGSWLMLAAGVLFAGGILVVAVERTNLWRRMPVERYAVDVRRSPARVDPMLPILGALLFALNSSGRAATLTWVAVALLGVIIISSLVVAEPGDVAAVPLRPHVARPRRLHVHRGRRRPAVARGSTWPGGEAREFTTTFEFHLDSQP